MDATTRIGTESVDDVFALINPQQRSLVEKVRQNKSQNRLIKRLKKKINCLLHLTLDSKSERYDDCLLLLFASKYADCKLESSPKTKFLGHACKPDDRYSLRIPIGLEWKLHPLLFTTD